MVNEKFNVKVAGTDTFIVCKKFNAFDCLTFINFIINLLPNDVEFPLTKKGASAIIMNIMDVGSSIKLSSEEKDGLKNMSVDDYFGMMFKYAFLNASNENQTLITDKLLVLYTYNNNSIDVTTANLIFPTAQILFSALLHAFRYNYNDFFIIGER